MGVTETSTKNLNAVTVKGSAGQFLNFIVGVKGAVPAFALSSLDSHDTGHNLLDSTFAQFEPFPRSSYRWRICAKSSPGVVLPDVCATDARETYELELSWLGATTYSVQVDQIDVAGVTTNIKTLTLTSSVATDTFGVSLDVVWT